MDPIQQSGEMPPTVPKSGRWLKIMAIIVAAAFIVTVAAVLTVKYFFFPSQFKPVTLSPKEEKALTEKIDRLNDLSSPGPAGQKSLSQKNSKPAPERYTEDDARRIIEFTEKEFNALIARNTDLADKLAVDFSGDLASMKLLVPMDPDFPILGGKTLKVTAGVELGYLSGKPVVKLRGVSLWGVPLPNAWLGNLKNVDLVNEFGNGQGFWQAFADGVEEIKVEEGHLRIKLKP